MCCHYLDGQSGMVKERLKEGNNRFYKVWRLATRHNGRVVASIFITNNNVNINEKGEIRSDRSGGVAWRTEKHGIV